MEEDSDTEDWDETPNTEDRDFLKDDEEEESEGDYEPTDESQEEVDDDDYLHESKAVVVERDQKVAEGEPDPEPVEGMGGRGAVEVRRQLTPDFEDLGGNQANAPQPPEGVGLPEGDDHTPVVPRDEPKEPKPGPKPPDPPDDSSTSSSEPLSSSDDSDTSTSSEEDSGSETPSDSSTSSSERERRRRKRKKQRKKREKKKRKKHPKHRRRERRQNKRDLDNTNESEESVEDGDVYYREPIHSVQYEMMHAYDPYDLKGVTPPYLQDGDRKARDDFRVKYIAYMQKHQNRMRKRPLHQRVLPATVVECIRPGLLAYICKHLLKKKHRTSKPEKVKAIVIHRWVMKRHRTALDAENNEGIKEVKNIKITLTGEAGVRSVQRAFIQLDEIKTKYRLRTNESEIIKWVTYNIEPKTARVTVQNYLKQSGRKAKRACRKLDCFHDLVMDIAQQFAKAFELGIGLKSMTKTSGRKTRNQKGNRDNESSGATNSSKTRDLKKLPKDEWLKLKKSLDAWIKEGKCVYCGRQHKVTECPTIPKNMKDWSWTRIFRSRGHASNSNAGAGGNNGNPGGDKSARRKASLTSNPGVKVTTEPFRVTVTLGVLGSVLLTDKLAMKMR